MPKLSRGKHRIDVIVSRELYNRFKKKLEEDGYLSMSAFLRNEIIKYLKEVKNENE